MRPNKTGVDWRSGSFAEREKMNVYQRKYRAANLEKVKKAARKNSLKKYGLTLEDYENLFNSQDGRCAICYMKQENELLCVDHCHRTSRVRGLLCRQCNRALGLFRDDPDLLFAAGEYVS